MILLMIWELIVRLQIFHKNLMPSIVSIFRAFFDDFNLIMKSTLYSFEMILLAFFLTTLLILFMLLLGKYSIFEDFFDYLNTILHPIPGVALLIVVITWFGIGIEGILFIMIHSMIWPVYTNVLLEYKRVRKHYQRIIDTFKLSRRKQILKVYLPGIAPGIISGAKTAWSRGWRAFISAEMILGMTRQQMGLGRYLFEKRIFMNIPGQYAGLIMIILVSLVIEYVLIEYIEKKTIRKWAI